MLTIAQPRILLATLTLGLASLTGCNSGSSTPSDGTATSEQNNAEAEAKPIGSKSPSDGPATPEQNNAQVEVKPIEWGKQEALPAPDAEFKLQVKDLNSSKYDESEAIREKYNGKVIELADQIIDVRKFINNTFTYVIGENPVDSVGRPQFPCQFKSKTPWLRALPGQTITVRGTYTVKEGGGGIYLKDSVIVDVKGESCLKLTANEVAKEYAVDDGRSFFKKYKGNDYIIITGQVKSTEASERSLCLNFVTENEYPVEPCFTMPDKELIETLKPGETVIVFVPLKNHPGPGFVQGTPRFTAGGCVLAKE